MAQTSTTILSSKSHKADITVTEGASFTASTKTIATTSTSLANLAQFDVISITGTTNNNQSFTVKSVATDGLSIVVEETVTDESSDGSTDTVIDHVGFVTDKQKGDGYYSQTDGVHTVAYQFDTSVIPSTSDGSTITIIDGIEVKVLSDKKGRIKDNIIQLAQSGSVIGSNKANANAGNIHTYGGSTDTWGTSLTYSDLSSLQVALKYSSGTIPHKDSVYVYSVQLKIYYT